ncbi:MAG TPA: histidine kinase [Acidimicrobiia bacterium]
MLELAPWERRVHRVITITLWVAMIIGASADIITRGLTTNVIISLVSAVVYVVSATTVSDRWFGVRFGIETVTLMGALVVAVTLTFSGGADSPYLLMSVGPTAIATLYGGIRAGLTTGLLSAGLLALISVATDSLGTQVVSGMALYILFVLLLATIRRLLQDIFNQAQSIALEGQDAVRQFKSLEETHNTLLQLSEDISAGRLNAVDVGATMLDTLINRFPGSAGKLIVNHDQGAVVLAARGVPENEGFPRTYPLATADSQIGNLEFTTPEMLGQAEEQAIEDAIQPVALAFANLQLLEEIVGTAVAEERIRLAREMHDEIGPSLASLGLALDMTAMQQSDDPELAADLMVLRSNVTKLVEDVRATVADLRSAPGPTITARIIQATVAFAGSPEVVVDIEERRPPRPAIIGDLTAIVTEAARNAHRHSKGTKIIISGQVDRSRGICAVSDDGVGFDPSFEPRGHFGLMGMKERAEKIGAEIEFLSERGVGTTITIEWGK